MHGPKNKKKMFVGCKIGKLQKPKHSGQGIGGDGETVNIPGLTQEDVKLKIKSIRSRYSSELAKVLKSEKKWRWPRRYV